MTPDARPVPRAGIALAVLLALHAVYGVALIVRQSAVVDGTRTFVLFDDAMVSMCYARTFAGGDGLVWHPGAARVEGITNPLWTLGMALVHLLPIGDGTTSLVVQLGSLALLGANLLVVHRLARAAGAGPRTALAAVVLTAASLPLNAWSLVGTEVGAHALLATAAALVAVRGIATRAVAPWAAGTIVAVAALVRLDGLVTALAGVALALRAARARARTVTAVAAGLVVGVVLPASARVLYYGDWLPNTYFLKLGGVPRSVLLDAGLEALWRFVVDCGWPLLLLALVAVSVWSRTPAGRVDAHDGAAGHGAAAARALVAIVAAQLAYVVAIGGDAWEWWGTNRFITPVLPLLFVLAALGLSRIHDVLEARLAPAAPARRALGPALAVVLLALLVQSNAIRRPIAGPLREMAGIDRLLNMEEHHEMVRMGLAAGDLTLPGARLAVAWAGTPIYFSHRGGVDLLGKSDQRIARGPVRPGPFVPGHMKWDSAYSLGELAPDAVLQLWESEPAAFEILARDYVSISPRLHDFSGSFWLRRGSSLVRWDQAGR